MKTFEREKQKYAGMVEAGKFRTKECAEQRKVCKGLEILEELKKSLVLDSSRLFAKLYNKELFGKLMDFD
jgi:hypothetical protein